MKPNDRDASKTPSRLFLLAGLAVGLMGLGADCQGNVVSDPTFRDWCGDSLCAWKTVTGQVRRVPTWTENDFGVAFDDKTEILQATEESAAKCLLFTSVADLDPAAEVTLAVDFNSDGSAEYTTTLASSSWHQVTSEITAPPKYEGITFSLTKKGTGAAILAEMRIQSTTDCAPAADPIKNLVMGEACGTGAECASGVCQPVGFNVCAECSDAVPCANGPACKQGSFGYAQCGPGEHLGNPGDPCATNGDCKSSSCVGAVVVPFAGGDAAACDPNAPTPASCFFDVVRGGKCH